MYYESFILAANHHQWQIFSVTSFMIALWISPQMHGRVIASNLVTNLHAAII